MSWKPDARPAMMREGQTVSRRPGRSVSVRLAYFSIASSRISRLDCRNCQSPLEIHQPNPNQPGKFLGTCPECGSWFRMEVIEGDGRALVIRLPESREVCPIVPPAGEMS